MPEAANSWSRISDWLDANAPNITSRMNAAATDADIKAVEQTVGASLPDDLKELLRIHNGGEETGIFPSSDSLDMLAFSPMATEEIIETWTMLKQLVDEGEFADRTAAPDDGIRTDWWSNSWIPFATNGGGDFQCVDLAPTESGNHGQIIGAWHDDTERQLIATSFGQYLQEIADGLENGKYVYEEDEGVVLADE